MHEAARDPEQCFVRWLEMIEHFHQLKWKKCGKDYFLLDSKGFSSQGRLYSPASESPGCSTLFTSNYLIDQIRLITPPGNKNFCSVSWVSYMTLSPTLADGWRQCSRSLPDGSSEKRLNPVSWGFLMPIRWFSLWRNSSTVVEPSKPTTCMSKQSFSGFGQTLKTSNVQCLVNNFM